MGVQDTPGRGGQIAPYPTDINPDVSFGAEQNVSYW